MRHKCKSFYTILLDSQDGITYYDYQVDVTPSFNSSTLISGSQSGSILPLSDFSLGTTYYWRVRGRHSTDTLAWSTVRNFTVTTILLLYQRPLTEQRMLIRM